jgi:hypothetical protein
MDSTENKTGGYSMVKHSKRFLFILMLTIFPSACSTAKTTPTIDPATTFTAAAMTKSAGDAAAASTEFFLSTLSAVPQASATPTPTGIPVPSATTRPVVVNNPVCDNSAFVSDVTIPDKTVIDAGDSFTKTWKFRNTGTCGWTTSYAIASAYGDAMSGTETKLPDAVEAGDEVDVSVDMVAPTANGTYTGYWKLKNADGLFFGEVVYVQIVVSNGEDTLTATLTPTSE